jgi:hypothetical protein
VLGPTPPFELVIASNAKKIADELAEKSGSELATVRPPQAARAQASEATQSNCAQLIL